MQGRDYDLECARQTLSYVSKQSRADLHWAQDTSQVLLFCTTEYPVYPICLYSYRLQRKAYQGHLAVELHDVCQAFLQVAHLLL